MVVSGGTNSFLLDIFVATRLVSECFREIVRGDGVILVFVFWFIIGFGGVGSVSILELLVIGFWR